MTRKFLFAFGFIFRANVCSGLVLSGSTHAPPQSELAVDENEPIYVHDDLTNEDVELQKYLSSRMQLRPMGPARSLMRNGRPHCIKRVALFHIPKTGGRTLMGVLRNVLTQVLNISPTEAVGMGNNKKNADMMSSTDGNHPFIVGFHTTQPKAYEAMPALKKANAQDHCGVLTATVLRDPLNRFVSMLNYNMETKCLPPDAHLHTGEYSEADDNVETRFHFTKKYCATCGAFWQHPHHCPPLDQDDLEHAKTLIHDSMDVVGVTEHLTQFLHTLLHEMGIDEDIVRKVVVPVAGKTKKDTGHTVSSLTKLQLDTIRGNLGFDQALYNISLSRTMGNRQAKGRKKRHSNGGKKGKWPVKWR